LASTQSDEKGKRKERKHNARVASHHASQKSTADVEGEVRPNFHSLPVHKALPLQLLFGHHAQSAQVYVCVSVFFFLFRGGGETASYTHVYFRVDQR
jgi:hypothetical protein